jgi:16S rRNA (uracil1498-N3)-methyltransferase
VSGQFAAPRLFVDAALEGAGRVVALGAAASRHAQVLRLQPGDALTLFDGRGGEWQARLASMGRREGHAELVARHDVERELPLAITLALGMPAGERMDFVVEKATELGVAAIQPLVCERSVLRLAGERADKRRAHWQAIAAAACEQCGRNRVPAIEAPRPLAQWLGALGQPAPDEARWLLGWRDATPWHAAQAGARVVVLSGPEGGFSDAEEALARTARFVAVRLGPRVLRADTAPLAVAAALALHNGAPTSRSS